MHRCLTTQLLASLALGATALAGDYNIKNVAPRTPLDEGWRFTLSAPGWIPWMEGDAGANGNIAHIDLGPDVVVPRIDMTADLRFEAQKGRLSILGEFLYVSLSDGIGTNTVVKKIDVQVDETMGDLALAWRLIDRGRGHLDVVAGVRYTNLYQKSALQPNDVKIDEVAGGLVVVGTLLRERVAQALVVLAGNDPTLPTAPLGGAEAARLATAIAKLKGSTAERKAKIARLLHDALGQTISRTDDWFDPYIGLRGRYNLNERFYVTAKGDIGGFGVGADMTWTAEAALGWQFTRNVFAEAGYRALGVDYDKDGLSMDTISHGPQATLGIQF